MKNPVWLLKWILKAAIFFTLFAFALNNQHEASVHFFFGTQWRTPLVLVLDCSGSMEGEPIAQLNEGLRVLEAELKPMDGVAAVLAALTVPFCLATSSSPRRLALSLRAAGLSQFFEGRCFTASEVQRGKPAPDLFLHAADRLGPAIADHRRSLDHESPEPGRLQAAGAAIGEGSDGNGQDRHHRQKLDQREATLP